MRREAAHGSEAAQLDEAAEGLRGLAALVGDVTADGAVTLRAPAAVWVQAGLPLAPGFAARLGAAAATVADADFAAAPQAARAQINQAVAAETAGKITGLLPPGAVSQRDAAGADQRHLPQGRLGHDLRGAGDHGRAVLPGRPGRPGGDRADDARHGGSPVPAGRGISGRRAAVPGRPAGHGRRPAGRAAGRAGPGARRPAACAALLAGTARHQVTLALPKFRLETALDLIPVLRRLGVTQAFTASADFGGITDAARLAVSAVAHKAYIDVDEQGTEAAAATAVSFRPTAAFRAAQPVTMTVDRPFLFAIWSARAACRCSWARSESRKDREGDRPKGTSGLRPGSMTCGWRWPRAGGSTWRPWGTPRWAAAATTGWCGDAAGAALVRDRRRPGRQGLARTHQARGHGGPGARRWKPLHWRCALMTASRIRRGAGSGVRARLLVRPVGPRYAMAVFPFLRRECGALGGEPPPARSSGRY